MTRIAAPFSVRAAVHLLALCWATAAAAQAPDPVWESVRSVPETLGRTPDPGSLRGRTFNTGAGTFFNGVFLGDAESKTEVIDRSIQDFTAMTGRRPALVKSFHAFNADFSATGWAGRLMRKVRDAGSTNFIALAPAWTSDIPTDSVLAAINDGSADDELTRIAHDMRDFRDVVLIEPGWEMNGRWGYRWQGVENIPAATAGKQYIAAWRRVVDIFRREGASNVRWVFSPNTGNPVVGGAPGPSHWNWYGHYYPGDDYVDYLGVHGFNGPSVWFRRWMPFEQLFSAEPSDYTLPDMVRRFPDKPLIISEVAAEADPDPAKRGEWIRDAFRQMIAHPRIVGVIWFNMKKETDWRVNTRIEVLRAYQEAIRDPRVSDTFRDVTRQKPAGGGRR